MCKVVDFAGDIHAKQEHDLTCSFPETHKCEVHHITCNPKFVYVKDIAKDHPWSAKIMEKRSVDRVLRPDNYVFYCFSKEKDSAAYNQQATSNIISIVKEGKLPDDIKCEAFLDLKRIPGGDRTEKTGKAFPDLPDGLSRHTSLEPLYVLVRDGAGVVMNVVLSIKGSPLSVVGKQWRHATAFFARIVVRLQCMGKILQVETVQQ